MPVIFDYLCHTHATLWHLFPIHRASAHGVLLYKNVTDGVHAQWITDHRPLINS